MAGFDPTKVEEKVTQTKKYKCKRCGTWYSNSTKAEKCYDSHWQLDTSTCKVISKQDASNVLFPSYVVLRFKNGSKKKDVRYVFSRVEGDAT